MTVRTACLALTLLTSCTQTSTHSSEGTTSTHAEEATNTASKPASATAEAPLAAPPRGEDSGRKSKNGKLEATVGGVGIEVHYGRPLVSGRAIFGELIPYGKLWRSGADEATTLVVKSPAKIADQAVAPGVYALFTVPGEKEWTLVLNAQAKQWGAYKHDPEKDVLKASVKSEAKEELTEILTFSSSDDALLLEWEKTQVQIPVAAQH